MSLIKSISGIRGTIGGHPGEGLTPLDIVRFTAAFGGLMKNRNPGKKIRIVVGRDARPSGPMVSNIVTATLMGSGIDVIDIGLTTTPTAEIAVTGEKAHGGIIITASHNPVNWNALKLLNEKGEFLSAEEGEETVKLSDRQDMSFSGVKELGTYSFNDTYIQKHIDKILQLPLVDAESIRKAKLKITVDGVNSTGGIAVPLLLRKLGVEDIDLLNGEPSGYFTHNPEPLPENITEICRRIVINRSDLGIVVDPDVDRLALVTEHGEPFGEEYTLVAVADYVLKNNPGNSVSNLSSTIALKLITEKYGGKYHASAVGEVNVVDMMKQTKAVIGGEGNGGVIYPDLHYGRDALAGIALFLTHLVKSGKTCSELRSIYPAFFISKNKINIPELMDVDEILRKMKDKYKDHPVIDIDGVKIHFNNQWVHLRKSNTEPIIRIYAESDRREKADELARKIITDLKKIINDNPLP
jgi:phosphomannomutase